MFYEVRDPVHGFIVFDEVERDVINSTPFQRLRRIKQLALTNMVYPGAVHTRFEHSLGVMEVASQLFDILTQKGGPELFQALGIHGEGERERLRRIVRLAALLHDVGHPPFSHAPEDLLPGGHEAMTAELIRAPELRSIIEDEHYRVGIRVESDIIPVAVNVEHSTVSPTAVHQFLSELITGVFGADRMDYLLRDSLHTGVKYGQFDLHRLIHTLTFVREPETGGPLVALEAGGVHAAEGLILARYFMFQQVYYHHVRRIYDHHLRRALVELLPHGRWPQVPEEYLAWDDYRVEAMLRDPTSRAESRWADILAGRRHFKLIFDAPEGEIAKYLARRAELESYLAQQFGDAVYLDAEERPLVKDRELNVAVLGRRGDLSSWFRESKVFQVLPPLTFLRVYADRQEDLMEEAHRYVSEFYQ